MPFLVLLKNLSVIVNLNKCRLMLLFEQISCILSQIFFQSRFSVNRRIHPMQSKPFWILVEFFKLFADHVHTCDGTLRTGIFFFPFTCYVKCLVIDRHWNLNQWWHSTRLNTPPRAEIFTTQDFHVFIFMLVDKRVKTRMTKQGREEQEDASREEVTWEGSSEEPH